jgi:hypothetical protein
VENPFQCNYLKDLEANGKLPLRWILMRQDVRMMDGTGSGMLPLPVAGFGISNVEPSGYTRSASDPNLFFIIVNCL